MLNMKSEAKYTKFTWARMLQGKGIRLSLPIFTVPLAIIPLLYILWKNVVVCTRV